MYFIFLQNPQSYFIIHSVLISIWIPIFIKGYFSKIISGFKEVLILIQFWNASVMGKDHFLALLIQRVGMRFN